jgi:hypothetical protein
VCCTVKKKASDEKEGGVEMETPDESKLPTTVEGWMRLVGRVAKAVEVDTFVGDNISRVLACSIGASPSDERAALSGVIDPWPPSVAEQLASDYAGMCTWIYGILASMALRRTEKRLSEVLGGDRDVATCADLVYAFEYINASLIDYDAERTMPLVLAELATGYLMKIDQRSMIEKIEDSMGSKDGSGVARQIGMAIGKTSFITPALIFHELLRKRALAEPWTTSAIVVVPQTLVTQTTQIMVEACSVLGMVDVRGLVGNFDPGDFGDRNRLLDPEHHMDHADFPDPTTFEPAGCVTVIGDKSLQRFYLRALKDRADEKAPKWSREQEELFIKRWKRSLVVCDEVDRVVNPLTCDMNTPSGGGFVKIPTDMPSVVDHIIGGGAVVSSVIEAKLDECQGMANDMVHDVDYGFGSEDWAKADDIPKNHMMAIPYAGAHNPMDGSQFTDFELSMVLTYRAYRHMIVGDEANPTPTFRRCDVRELATSIPQLIGGIASDWIKPPDIFRAAIPSAGAGICDVLADAANGKKTAKVASAEISSLLAGLDSRDREAFAKRYAAHVMAKYAAFSARQVSTGMREFLTASRCRARIMFSGTIRVAIPEKTELSLLKMIKGLDVNSHIAISKRESDDFTHAMVASVLSGCTCQTHGEEEGMATTSGGGGRPESKRRKIYITAVSRGHLPPPDMRAPVVYFMDEGEGGKEGLDMKIMDYFSRMEVGDRPHIRMMPSSMPSGSSGDSAHFDTRG